MRIFNYDANCFRNTGIAKFLGLKDIFKADAVLFLTGTALAAC